MLERVHVGIASASCYERVVGADVMARLRKMADALRGIRVLYINATPYGGGVAEILFSEVPLLNDLGIHADWRIIADGNDFFRVTKKIHNGLQGSDLSLTSEDQQIYLDCCARNARLLDDTFDIVFVHDPQPLAIMSSHNKKSAKWIWRCHIDTSEPNPRTWDFLRSHLV